MQRRKQLHAHHAAEGIIRRHQQRASLAGTEIDEGKVFEVYARLLLQRAEHFVKQRRFGGLVRRSENPEQPVVPADRCAGGVDPMIPVIVCIAVALAQARARRVANEFPQSTEQLTARSPAPVTSGGIAPPAACGRENACWVSACHDLTTCHDTREAIRATRRERSGWFG